MPTRIFTAVCLLLALALPAASLRAAPTSSFNLTIVASGTPPAAACGDAIDNDGDALIDFPADPGCASLTDTDETNTPPSPGGGGGGGGGGVAPPPVTESTATVVFIGRASPYASVSVLQDAQTAATAVAGADASFSVALSGLSSGAYAFDLLALDVSGLRTQLYPVRISVSAGSMYYASAILLAPTAAFDQASAAVDGALTVRGMTVPGADVYGAIDDVAGADAFHAVAATDGRWEARFPVAGLATGSHYLKVRATFLDETSPVGSATVFTVGAVSTATAPEFDLNGDGRINIIDFSILAYWYKRPNPPARLDVNHDGIVDIRDFSMLAYRWTG